MRHAHQLIRPRIRTTLPVRFHYMVEIDHFQCGGVVRRANVVVVYIDGVELVAVQDEGFACALCLNSEEAREEVGRVEVRGCGLFGFRKGFFFGFLFVIRDRGKVRKLKLVVEEEVRGRVGRFGRVRVAQVVRDALPFEAHPPAGPVLLWRAGCVRARLS